MPDDETFKMFMQMVEKGFANQAVELSRLAEACHAMNMQIGEVDKARMQLALIAAADHALLTQHLMEAEKKTKKSYSIFGKLFGG
jgi:uncharacterized UPF0160 family protein